MEANTLNIKNNCVLKPTLQELKIIYYEGKHFMNCKWLSMKVSTLNIKNDCVWRPVFCEVKIIVYESQHSKH